MNFKKIAQDLDKLDALYQEQIRSFDTQVLPDLEAQTEDRKRVFDQFKKHMAAFLAAIKDKDVAENFETIEEMNRHLKLLAHQNDALKNKVEAFKTELKASMTRLKTGKRVINAYRAPQSVRNRPKVLTIRNY